ncbi:tetratricopeptide repeat protein [Iodobacter sp. HSC-16F04]|uniref:Ancillary SecYEG translocon subunit n=1 Tax=Iodobacter violaceini TaxID=3044271 RepID=A0ABX0KSR8_9NEIS|nr:tetratricopeptide repeat protein [Iodobacter violacea]NHQ87671.1 tetratricopeptide repeat protein [Iodobacter violacea]
MAFDLQEQEQIAEFKAWWDSWGKLISLGLLAALVAYAGWKGWNAYLASQSAKAGVIYAELDKQAQAKDLAKMKPAAEQLKKDYSGTAFASRGALLLAKSSAEANDVPAAVAQLQWVIANAKEAGLRDVARLRLAAVQLDQKKFDDALATLKSNEETSFAGLFFEAKGDVLLIKGDKAAARESYKQAVAKLPKEAPNVKFVEVKLEALGNS